MWPFTRRPEPAPQGNPLPALLDLSHARSVLVIAPHPDDETLGCGGTLALLAKTSQVHVLLVTNGDGGGGLPEETSAVRKQEMAAALGVLGIRSPVRQMDEPDGRFVDSARFRAALAQAIRETSPNWVLLPWLLDSHSDHARISRASSELLQTTDVETLAYYETWTPLPATHVVDITSTIEQKKAALACHETALRHGNYLEAMEGLNAYRALYLPRDGRRHWAEAYAVTGARDNRFL